MKTKRYNFLLAAAVLSALAMMFPQSASASEGIPGKVLNAVVQQYSDFLELANDSTLLGPWRGDLVAGSTKIPLVFNFSKTDGGAVKCTLDSPMQNAKGIPSTITYCSGDSIVVSIDMIGASFSGRISPALISGTLSQNGYSFPLSLTPDNIPLEERRPQTPRPPFPYTAVDTTFTAPDGARLSATLTMPAKHDGDKVPAIVMVTGSGPQNRDEELFDHRPFAVIADYLARNGIASLRYDDRGTAKSSGDFASATTFTFKDDARSAIDFLRTFPSIGKTGVLGHSEGGTVALMLGAEGSPDFIISLAGMAESGKKTMMRQNERSLAHAGVSETDRLKFLNLLEAVFDTIASQNKAGVSSPIDIDAIVAASGVDASSPLIASMKQTVNSRTPWLDTFVALNPGEFLRDIKCPLLAVNGDNDTQVHPDNLSLIKKEVPGARTLLMPRLNHLMQHSVTGELDEYGAISETISPEVLEAIVSFIREQAKP